VPYLLPSQIEVSKNKLTSDLKMLRPYINSKTVFLEIGPGNCIFAFGMAPFVAQFYAVDVSAEVTKNSNPPANFKLVISDGTDIPVAPASIDFAYSNQLMEHLHPDDATEQLKNIFRALKPNGKYFCRTPNRLSGPHDISGFFDNEATGFHLKEYTVSDLTKLLRSIGFRKFQVIIGAHGMFITLSCWPIILLEKILSSLPIAVGRPIGRFAPFRLILGIKLLAIK
jgi:SAM-dependent methyltransferase